jgi:hypothetical protein
MLSVCYLPQLPTSFGIGDDFQRGF